MGGGEERGDSASTFFDALVDIDTRRGEGERFSLTSLKR